MLSTYVKYSTTFQAESFSHQHLLSLVVGGPQFQRATLGRRVRYSLYHPRNLLIHAA